LCPDGDRTLANSSDLNGVWTGLYSYFASEDVGQCPFKARIVVNEGQLSGLVIEPHPYANSELKAEIRGTVIGKQVEFEKKYKQDSESFTRVVTYSGRISDDHKAMAGTWTHSDGSGQFEMSLKS